MEEKMKDFSTKLAEMMNGKQEDCATVIENDRITIYNSDTIDPISFHEERVEMTKIFDYFKQLEEISKEQTIKMFEMMGENGIVNVKDYKLSFEEEKFLFFFKSRMHNQYYSIYPKPISSLLYSRLYTICNEPSSIPASFTNDKGHSVSIETKIPIRYNYTLVLNDLKSIGTSVKLLKEIPEIGVFNVIKK